MEFREVYSSVVDSIGYDPETESLHVVWKKGGKTSIYGPGISPKEAEAIMNAPSVGSAVRGLTHGHKYG